MRGRAVLTGVAPRDSAARAARCAGARARATDSRWCGLARRRQQQIQDALECGTDDRCAMGSRSDRRSLSLVPRAKSSNPELSATMTKRLRGHLRSTVVVYSSGCAGPLSKTCSHPQARPWMRRRWSLGGWDPLCLPLTAKTVRRMSGDQTFCNCELPLCRSVPSIRRPAGIAV